MLSRPIMAASIAWPARQLDHQRDDAAVREVDAVDWVARLIQNGLVLQFSGFEVRSQQLEVRRDQRSQQTIGGTGHMDMVRSCLSGGSTDVSLSH